MSAKTSDLEMTALCVRLPPTSAIWRYRSVVLSFVERLMKQNQVRTTVKSPVKTKVLSATCAEKSPFTTKVTTLVSDTKTPSKANDSGTTSEEETNLKSVAYGSVCQQSDKSCEKTIKLEKVETNSNNLEAKYCTETCEKLNRELKTTQEEQSVKIKKMKHVMVLDEDKDFCIELPLENDDTLPLKLLQSQFPGICGLTYRSHECPHRQWIALDRGKLCAPKGGWNHDLYTCVFSKQSGGKWLHTFCHCSFSKPSKSKQVKFPTKSQSKKSNPSRNQIDDVTSKNTKNGDADVYIVEGKKEMGSRECSEIMVFSLPPWVSDKHLRKHFSKFGTVLTSTIKKDLVGAHFGTVKFQHFHSQEKALAEVFHRFGETWCSVRPRS